ncbi:hypothetical protein CMI45_02765 [Candidatus Pacearchaeota archaeon]|nr:hypothetical protein [Candidatus Pacearchaeota archaeon]|tara:strand:- start:3850 stop:5514 length:1665 start_codon:yes stop_codon:yes gene_type:complete
MAADIHKLIGAINPDLFCSNRVLKSGESDNRKDKTVRDLVKRIVKEELDKINDKIEQKKKQGLEIKDADKETDIYLKAAKKVELIENDYLDIIETRFASSAMSLQGIKNPIEKHTIDYDITGQPTQILEEHYFWILDYINAKYKRSFKLVDNFITSPGSSLFTDMLQKRSTAEQNASRLIGNLNEVTKSVLNLIYSLREFQTVLFLYDDYNSEDKAKKSGALLALKQRWLDKVDILRGGSSIKQLSITGANQPNFVLLIDAFMKPETLEAADKLDLNDRLKRLVKQRLEEFYVWLNQSEGGLRGRYRVERNYLKSQMNVLRLYAHWLKPYLKESQRLEQSEDLASSSSFVNAFNTALFELTVVGEGAYDPKGDIASGELPEYFKKLKLQSYVPLVLVEFKYRATPESLGQHARFRGKAEISITSYALTSEEIELFKKQVEKDNLGDILGAISGASEDSLEQIKLDVDEILGEIKPDLESFNPKKTSEANPFTALFDFFKPMKKSKDENQVGLSEDSNEEQVLRSQSLLAARWESRILYDTFKKALDMPAFPPVL